MTLIEILVVLAIIGVLSFLLFPPISAQLTKARDARRKLDFNLIANSLEQNYDSIGYYPPSLVDCDQPLILNGKTYLASIPCDPKTKTSYLYLSDGNDNSGWFKLYANLERTDDQIIDMVGCRYGCGPDCQYNFGISSPNIGLDYCTSEPILTLTPSQPTPTPILYACSPASGPQPEGRCEAYDDPFLSQCPKIYPNDPTCANECGLRENRCKNASGKHKPE